jgi:segregation and condensation protein B
MSRRAEIEALLFATDQPLSVARFEEVLRNATRAEIQSELDALTEHFAGADGPIALVRVAGGYQLATKPQYAELVSRLFRGKRRVRLTRAALEALAIIAYKQPTTRPEIDAIRGVSSGGVIETLLERNLVRIAGRSDGVGRPLLYATTEEFLQYLGLDHLRELPSLEELEAMLAAREEEARRAEDEERLLEEQASDAAEVPAAATLDERLRARDLLTLDELDEELETRGRRIQEVSARVAQTRSEHAAETASPAAQLGADGDDGSDAASDDAPHDAIVDSEPAAAQTPEVHDAEVEPRAP